MSEDRYTYNLAQSTNFRLVIPDPNGIGVNYYLQNCQLPGINVSNIQAPWKNHQGFVPDNVVEYDPIIITYLVAEDLSNYIFLKKWLENAARYDSMHDHFKDLTLHILNNNKMTNAQVRFQSAFPISLTELSLDSTAAENVDLINTATIVYQKFEIFTGETS